MRLPLLVAFVLIAGCAAPTTPPPAGDAGATTARAPVVLHSCHEMAADFPVDSAAVAAKLPEGFAPRPLAPGGQALLEVIFVRCESDAAGEEGVEASLVWTPVLPPDEWRAEGVGFFFYVFALTTAHEGVAQALLGVGAPVTLAPTTYAPGAAPIASRGEVQGEGWTLALETRVPPRDTTRSHPIVRVFVADEAGAITHALDVDPGSHPHQEPGAGTIAATGAPPFPVPTAPGLAVHGTGGHLGFTYVAYDMMGEPPAENATVEPS